MGDDDKIKVVLAGPEKGALRPGVLAMSAHGLDVVGTADAAETLELLAGGVGAAGVSVVQVDMWLSAEDAVAALAALPTMVAVILPQWWEGERAKFSADALPNMIAGFTEPVDWGKAAEKIKERVAKRTAAASPSPLPSPPPPPSPAPPAQTTPAKPQPTAARPARPAGSDGAGGQAVPPASSAPAAQPPAVQAQVVGLWSGTTGGTGRSTLALLVAMEAVERGVDAAVLALAEPGLAPMLALPRTPNVLEFLAGRSPLSAAAQRVAWEATGKQFSLPIYLRPLRLEEGIALERSVALIGAVREAHAVVIVDLPVLGVPWLPVLLERLDAVVLVAAPSATGIAGVVEALVALEQARMVGAIHLVVNHRAPHGLSARAVAEGVGNLWGNCPPALSIPYSRDLAAEVSPSARPEAIQRLAEAILGLPPLEPETPARPGRQRQEKEQKAEKPQRPSRRLLPRIELVE